MPQLIESLKRIHQHFKSQKQMVEKLQITNSNLSEFIRIMKEHLFVELQINDRLHKKLSILRKVNEERNLIKKVKK